MTLKSWNLKICRNDEIKSQNYEIKIAHVLQFTFGNGLQLPPQPSALFFLSQSWFFLEILSSKSQGAFADYVKINKSVPCIGF